MCEKTMKIKYIKLAVCVFVEIDESRVRMLQKKNALGWLKSNINHVCNILSFFYSSKFLSSYGKIYLKNCH